MANSVGKLLAADGVEKGKQIHALLVQLLLRGADPAKLEALLGDLSVPAAMVPKFIEDAQKRIQSKRHRDTANDISKHCLMQAATEVGVSLSRAFKGPDGLDLPVEAHVFGDETGRMLSRERLCERWRATCAAAKVDNLHLHDLRGEFGSRMAEANIPLHEVRDALGHANLSMTSTYLRTRVDSLDEAYRQLERHRLTLVKGSGPSVARDDSDQSESRSA